MSDVEGALRSALRMELGAVGFVPTASKLHAPSPGVVPRSVLVEQVSAARADVITVTAPAGYGKSTFIADFVADDPRPAAWVSLSATDNDPATLLTYVALAIDDIDAVDPNCVSALWVRSPTIGTAELQRFGAMLAERRHPFVLVLDDVHELVSRDVLDLLPVAVAEMPAGSTIVLGSRTAIPLPLGRLRVRRRVVEVGPAELAFDAVDAAILLDHLGLAVSQEDTERIVDRTEGWPVAVYLAALAQQRRTIGSGIVEGFAGDHRYVVEYLGDELLGRLDADTATFLIEASCLERFSGRMCDDVLQRRGSAELLEAIQRRNLLVIPLDDRREWYRFHHLMAEFLQSELERRDPAHRAALHLRASEWYEARGDADGAITHALLASDVPRAERLVLHWFGRMVAAGRFQTIDRWINLFTDDELAQLPGVMVVAAHTRFGAGQPGAALLWLARAEAVLPERHPSNPQESTTALQVAVARALIVPMSPDEMAAESRYSYDHARFGEGYPLSCLMRGAAAFMLGDEVEAVLRFGEAVESTLHRPTVEGSALAHLAMINAEHERWHEATAEARRATAAVGDAITVPSSALILAVRVLAETHAGHGDDVEADRHLCRRNLGDLVNVAPWLNLQARIALARAALIRSDRVEAAALIDEAEAILGMTPGAVRVAEQLAGLRRMVVARDTSHGYGPASLTTAELRVLELLPTHLTVAEIADRLYVSRNTVKSQTIAIYRKLGTSSRGGAVERAVAAGLLDTAAHPG